ncbi:GT2 family glycosyltransferase [Kribbella sp. VKM Ac-2527]|uniref:GT2 family glycosyltransferase n=1 Tax=Kribbella caucasensis TaxID=2512215 RepID=A0A4R6K6A1_9ACTN|nr:glycosyltransferase family A protein [Kribbella sp. VKM Ac-2527]TDO43356.1 GT2 family glycosyltransferase [Kribbella sp. VKM Ac-2527]
MSTPAMTPSVSVVVATRNRPELLRKALGSIAAQDYPGPVELVVVYDQSQRETGLTADLPLTGQAGERSIHVITNTRTPGLAGARNSGVTRSDGELLAFCDDDDSWRPDKLTNQVAMLTRMDAGLSVCGIRITIGDQTHIRIPTPADVTVDELARRRVMEAHPSTVLVSRAAFERIGWVDEELPGGYAEDYDWMLRALAAEKVAVVSKPLVEVLWHPGSFFTTRWAVIIEALDYMVDKHAVIRNSPRGLARIYGQKAVAYAALRRRSESSRWAMRALRLAPGEKRGYLALAIASGVVPANRVLQWANARGRGV